MPIDTKKFKKRELGLLIDEYEETIQDLTNQINTNQIKEKFIILDKKEDNKYIIYIKKRLKVVKDEKIRERYEKELKRLLDFY